MSPDQLAIPICRHVKTNGLRCQSPALNGEPFCYFHVRLHKEHPVPLTAREMVNRRNLQYEGYEEALIGAGEDPMQIARAYPNQNEFHFPPLEDAESIQLAASMLFHAIAQGQVHLRRARLLRDMLRVAAVSCRLNKPDPKVTTSTIREIDHTPEGVAIAPANEPSNTAELSPAQAGIPEPPQPGSNEPPQPGSNEPPQQTSEEPEYARGGDFSPGINPTIINRAPESCSSEPPQQPAEKPEHLIGRDFSPGINRTGINGALAPETCTPEPPHPNPELPPNQYFGYNPLAANILPEPPQLSITN